jgi:hypothetical protein
MANNLTFFYLITTLGDIPQYSKIHVHSCEQF